MPRPQTTNPMESEWLPVAAFGAVVILAGIGLMIGQLVVSFRHRDELRDVSGDPWNGRTR